MLVWCLRCLCKWIFFLKLTISTTFPYILYGFPLAQAGFHCTALINQWTPENLRLLGFFWGAMPGDQTKHIPDHVVPRVTVIPSKQFQVDGKKYCRTPGLISIHLDKLPLDHFHYKLPIMETVISSYSWHLKHWHWTLLFFLRSSCFYSDFSLIVFFSLIAHSASITTITSLYNLGTWNNDTGETLNPLHTLK